MKPFGTRALAMEAARKALVEKYKSYYPGEWPAKPEAAGLVEAAVTAYLANIYNDDLDSGREFMRRAWYELNAIRARSGAPEGVSEEYFSLLVDSLAFLLKDEARPWMTQASKTLIGMECKKALDAAQALADARADPSIDPCNWPMNTR